MARILTATSTGTLTHPLLRRKRTSDGYWLRNDTLSYEAYNAANIDKYGFTMTLEGADYVITDPDGNEMVGEWALYDAAASTLAVSDLTNAVWEGDAGGVVLANGVTHGGSTAMLRLGGSGGVPGLWVTGGTNTNAVMFQSTGGDGHGIFISGSGEGSGMYLTSGVIGYSLRLARDVLGNLVTSNSVAVSGANKIADHVLRRNQASVESSADGDTFSVQSLYGFIQMAQEANTIDNAGYLTVYQTDGTTELGRRQLTTQAGSPPVVGVK